MDLGGKKNRKSRSGRSIRISIGGGVALDKKWMRVIA